jgi:hypothetical protein
MCFIYTIAIIQLYHTFFTIGANTSKCISNEAFASSCTRHTFHIFRSCPRSELITSHVDISLHTDLLDRWLHHHSRYLYTRHASICAVFPNAFSTKGVFHLYQ